MGSLINIILVIICFFCVELRSQTMDTLILKKRFFEAEDLERTNPDSARKLYHLLIKDAGSNFKNKIIATAYHRLADVDYQLTNDFKKYFDYNFKAIRIFEAINDSFPTIRIYENLGIYLAKQSRFKEAIVYHRIAYNYSVRNHNSELLMSAAISLADNYCFLSKSDTALIILQNLERNFPKDLKQNDLATLYCNLGNTYFNNGEATFNKKYFENAIEYSKKALLIFKTETDDPSDISFCLGLLGAAYMKLGKYSDAEVEYLNAIKIEERLNHITDLNTLYAEMTVLQIKQGNKEKALDFFYKKDSVSSLIYNESNSSSISEMKTLFETEKKEQQNKALVLENTLTNQTIKQQRIITFVIIGGLVLLSMFAIFVLRGLKQQRTANLIISDQKKIVEQQKELVEEHQKEILDSIHYAKRIQNTLLAHHEFVEENLPHNFILFQPKDIVSGDFYWATKHGDNFYLAVCDSTGHGVPGAFMSLLNIGFLNEAINEKDILEPHEIFNHVRQRLITTISKEEQKDGFDGILLRINQNTKKITYAAAHNAPILISDDQLTELEKDKMPVGKGEREEQFTLYTITAKPGDSLYLYTDGYADQFGGPKGKKFKYKPLNELLLAINKKPLKEQSDILQQTFNDWKGDLEQVDDVCVIGIKMDMIV